jgi:hypothetical protein
MRAGHRWRWFIGLYAASVVTLAIATFVLKKVLGFFT